MRFLHRDKNTGSYFEASEGDVRKKVSQRLRELALDVKEHEDSEDEIQTDGTAQTSFVDDCEAVDTLTDAQ